MFRLSRFVKIDRVTTQPGTSTIDNFKLKVDVDGRRHLVSAGKINTYEQIQSHKDSCDVEYILTRFANGDASALAQKQGVYGDFANVPTSIVELQQRVVDAERLFYQQPLEIREKFEHNPSLFYAMIGTDAFNDLMGIDKTIDNPIVNSTLTGGASMTDNGGDAVVTESE